MHLESFRKELKNAVIIPGKNGEEAEIKKLTTDSREQAEKSLFFCIKGEKTDSHERALEAVKNGAVAVVTERTLALDVPQLLVEDSRFALGKLSGLFYGYPARKMQVIGITGTNGKTTTSYMLASILESAKKKVGVIGTLGIKYCNVEESSDLTTPDPVFLQETLSEMEKSGVEYVVMEVSAHALYYKKVVGVDFAACIFTNCTQDHLDFFDTMQKYKAAKKKLFTDYACPLAIVCGDDETGREIGAERESKNGERTCYFGLNTPSDAFAVITEETLFHSASLFNVNDTLCRISLKLPGRHNVYNALAAATCAIELGIDGVAVEKGLSALTKVEGRLERVASVDGAEIFVDFAHTPDGLEKSLEFLRRYCKGRLICLFGCGGNRDKEKRPLMGEVAAKKADFSVLTSDNPRYEDPLDILSEVEKGYRRYSIRYVIVPERKRGISYALDCLKRGDILLVAGKGGEKYQEIMGIKYAFQDKDIIEKLLSEKRKNF